MLVGTGSSQAGQRGLWVRPGRRGSQQRARALGLGAQLGLAALAGGAARDMRAQRRALQRRQLAVEVGRELLARVLTRHGLVNYPTEWWHWSYGDRYWAFTTGHGTALYGPVATLS